MKRFLRAALPIYVLAIMLTGCWVEYPYGGPYRNYHSYGYYFWSTPHYHSHPYHRGGYPHFHGGYGHYHSGGYR